MDAATRRWLVPSVLVVLSIIILLARAHTCREPLENDITAYAVIAHEMLNGRRLYVEAWENKPPAVFVTYALAELAVGFGDAAIYGLGVTAAIVTLLGAYRAGRALGGPTAGIWAAVFWTASCSHLYLQANQPSTEVFMNAFLVWALALLLDADLRPFTLRHAVLVGVFFVLASLYKHVVAVYAVLACLVHVVFPPQGKPERSRLFGHVVVIGAIGIAAWGAVAGYFLLTGGFEDFYRDVFSRNIGYAGDILTNVAGPLRHPARPLAAVFNRLPKPLILLSLPSVIGLALSRRKDGIPWRQWMLLVAFGIATYLAVAMPGKFFPHYFQLCLPLLAVCGGLGVVALGRLFQKREADGNEDETGPGAVKGKGPAQARRGAGACWPHVVGALVLASLLWQEIPLYRLSPEEWSRRKYGERFVDSVKMGREIGLLLKPDERFYEWGNESGLFYYSRRRPASRHWAVWAITTYGREAAERVPQEILADLERSRPELFVVHKPDYPVMQSFPQIARFLETGYRPLPGGHERGPFLLFARRGGALETRLGTGAKPDAEIDADAEKVLVIADFETEDEISNHADARTVARVRARPDSTRAVWIGVENAKWQAGRLERSTEHVLHGKHSLKVHANVGSGHAWTPTVKNSFPKDWSDYDAIRFFVHWPEEKSVQWATFIWLRYTNAEGGRTWIQPWLLYTMKPGDTHVEIPLAAFDDLKWPGLPGIGGGKNMTAMTLWKQNEKYAYIHEVGWRFDEVYKMALGLRGKYDGKVPHHYWMDYVRLVKWKVTRLPRAQEKDAVPRHRDRVVFISCGIESGRQSVPVTLRHGPGCVSRAMPGRGPPPPTPSTRPPSSRHTSAEWLSPPRRCSSPPSPRERPRAHPAQAPPAGPLLR